MSRTLNAWSTMRNPELVPTPRTREEWHETRQRCSPFAAETAQRVLDYYGLSGRDVYGHGFESCWQLSDYAVKWVASLVEMHREREAVAEQATKRAFQDWYASRVGERPTDPELPAVTVHPVLRCGVCGGRRPHTRASEFVVICDSCGTRTEVAS